MTAPGQRIHVIGTSGSGKTTLAGQISRALGIPHIELDALHWLPGWIERPREDFRVALTERLAGEAWVVDGNYGSRARDLVWARADTIVWLDLPRATVMRQVLRRTVRRVWTREELWNGNRESLRAAFSRDSILWWAWSTYTRRRREYRELLRQVGAEVVTLRSRAEVERWVRGLG